MSQNGKLTNGITLKTNIVKTALIKPSLSTTLTPSNVFMTGDDDDDDDEITAPVQHRGNPSLQINKLVEAPRFVNPPPVKTHSFKGKPSLQHTQREANTLTSSPPPLDQPVNDSLPLHQHLPHSSHTLPHVPQGLPPPPPPMMIHTHTPSQPQPQHQPYHISQQQQQQQQQQPPPPLFVPPPPQLHQLQQQPQQQPPPPMPSVQPLQSVSVPVCEESLLANLSPPVRAAIVGLVAMCKKEGRHMLDMVRARNTDAHPVLYWLYREGREMDAFNALMGNNNINIINNNNNSTTTPLQVQVLAHTPPPHMPPPPPPSILSTIQLPTHTHTQLPTHTHTPPPRSRFHSGNSQSDAQSQQPSQPVNPSIQPPSVGVGRSRLYAHYQPDYFDDDDDSRVTVVVPVDESDSEDEERERRRLRPILERLVEGLDDYDDEDAERWRTKAKRQTQTQTQSQDHGDDAHTHTNMGDTAPQDEGAGVDKTRGEVVDELDSVGQMEAFMARLAHLDHSTMRKAHEVPSIDRHQHAYKYHSNTSASTSSSLASSLSSSSLYDGFGARLMANMMGWRRGDGLGRTGEGITGPVEASLHPHKKGVGFNKKKRQRQRGDHDYEEEYNSNNSGSGSHNGGDASNLTTTVPVQNNHTDHTHSTQQNTTQWGGGVLGGRQVKQQLDSAGHYDHSLYDGRDEKEKEMDSMMDAFTQRMKSAYNKRPNPLNNPRRPY